MRNFQKKGIWGRILQSKPALILLGIIILTFAWSIFRFSARLRETDRNRQIAEDKVIQLRQQKEKLAADIESLNTDAGKERVFRENFGLAKEGEEVIVIVDDKSVPATQNNSYFFGFFSFLKGLFE
jgi:cell division protein FtsB